MKVVPLYCTNCGAPIGKDAKFCSQCGSPIVIDDGVKRSEHTVRHIDEARIRENEANELLRLRKMEADIIAEREKTKREKSGWTFSLIAMVLFFGGFFFFTYIMTH